MTLSILDDVLQSFEKEHSCRIHSELIQTHGLNEFFAMSIIPDNGTMNQMIQAFTAKQSGKFIPLWKKCKDWTLEVDSQVVRLLSDNELCALTYHELGHYIANTSIPNQLLESFQYYAATSTIGQRALMAKDTIKNILKVPFIVNCELGKNMSDVKMRLKKEAAMRKEYAADSYAAKNGYYNDLMSAMGKISNMFETGHWRKDEAETAYKFTSKTLDNLRKRQLHLTHTQMKGLKKYLPPSRLEKAVNELDADFESVKNLEEEAASVYEQAFEEEAFMESNLFKKNINLITSDQISYIQNQIYDMRTETDRMMLLSYTNGKLEIVMWCIENYDNPKFRKKYNLNVSLDTLVRYRSIITNLQKQIMSTKLVPKVYELQTPIYPDGYEG